MNGTASGHYSIDTIVYSSGGEDAAHNNMPLFNSLYVEKSELKIFK